MSRGADIPSLIEHLRIFHVAVAQPIWHFQLIEDFDRLSKMIVRRATIAQLLFETAEKTLHQADDDPFSDCLAHLFRLLEIGARKV